MKKMKIICEGGQFHHMLHPYEDLELTFNDLISIISNFMNGTFAKDNITSEKVDGQNIMVSFRNGHLICARNSSHVKEDRKNALDIEGLSKMFDGRGEIQKAFVDSTTDLENAIKKLNKEEIDNIFDNGNKFLNVEIITPQTENTIPYGKDMLIPHGTVTYDYDGNKIGSDESKGKELVDKLKEVNATQQKRFVIKAPEKLKIYETPASEEEINIYKDKILNIIKPYRLLPKDTIYNYLISRGKDVLRKQINLKEIKSDDFELKDIIERLLGLNRNVNIRLIKKLENKAVVEKIISIDKNNKKFVNEVYKPLRTIILKFGIDVLKHTSNLLSESPKESVDKIKKELNNSIEKIKEGNDEKDLEALNNAYDLIEDKLKDEDILPSEGVVFTFKGKLYKLTGAFALINKMLGILKYKKITKEVPTLSSMIK